MKEIEFDIHPSARQAEFFASRAKFTAYGGARGGGKSWALRHKIVLLCLRFPGLRSLIVRRTFPELRENHVLPLLSLVVKNELATYSETNKTFNFINGSSIKMGYLDSENDLLQYQGQEFDVIAIDEATQFTEYSFSALSASLRGVNDFPKRMYLTCNPGGVGHAWVKRIFIDRDFRSCEDPNDYKFIQALVFDNDALMKNNPDYVRQLEALPCDLKKAWLYGEWDAFAGQFFTEFDPDIHTCDVALPENTTRYCAIDYGLDMLAALFVAVDGKGRAYVYDEIYESGLIVSEAAKLIFEKKTDDMLFIAPSDLWSRQKDSGKSIAELFAEGGVYLTKLAPSRVAGWLALKEWLKPLPDGGAMMTIDRKCKNIIRCLPLLQHDKDSPDDASTQPHEITHAPDALRYFASFRICESEAQEQSLFRKRLRKYL